MECRKRSVITRAIRYVKEHGLGNAARRVLLGMAYTLARNTPSPYIIDLNPALNGTVSSREDDISRRRKESGPSTGTTASYQNFEEFLKSAVLVPSMRAPFTENDYRILGLMDWIKQTLIKEYSELPQVSRVSIIMPTYNRAHIIGRAIDSVLSQSYQNWELIVVDDGGCDNTEEIVSSYSDERIRYVRLTENQGVSAARNQGIQYASGDLFAYLDSDNTWEQDFLLLMVNTLARHPGAHMVYCAQNVYRVVRKDGAEEASLEQVRFGPFNRALLENRNFIDLNTILHDRWCLEEYGPFRPNLRRLTDWDLILRYTQSVAPIALACVLSNYYHDQGNNQITNSGHYAEALVAIDEVLRQNDLSPKLGPFKVGNYPLFGLMEGARNTDYRRKVTIVIPSFEVPEYLAMCIESVKLWTDRDRYDLIIVDNNSGPDVQRLLELVSRLDPSTRVIQNEKNLGFTYAANQGIVASDPESDIILLNNDALVTPGWLEGLQEVVEKVPDVGLVVPRQTLPPGTKTMQVHSPFCTTSREIDVSLSVHHANVLNPLFDPINGFMELSFAPFFCVYIPRETLRLAGLLDYKNGPHYRSDRLYCDVVRFWLGKRIIYTPHSKVYHFLQQSTTRLKLQDSKMFAAMFVKNNWPEINQNGQSPASSG